MSNSVSKPNQLFEFILDILSDAKNSSFITWEGTEGQFRIIDPVFVASLWGERNGRPNMTYQKLSRAMRYHYHKKVLTKIPHRRYAYKFDLRELKMQYAYRGLPLPASNPCICSRGHEFPASCEFSYPSQCGSLSLPANEAFVHNPTSKAFLSPRNVFKPSQMLQTLIHWGP